MERKSYRVLLVDGAAESCLASLFLQIFEFALLLCEFAFQLIHQPLLFILIGRCIPARLCRCCGCFARS